MSAFLYTVTFGGAPGPYLPLAGTSAVTAMADGATIYTANRIGSDSGSLLIGSGNSDDANSTGSVNLVTGVINSGTGNAKSGTILITTGTVNTTSGNDHAQVVTTPNKQSGAVTIATGGNALGAAGTISLLPGSSFGGSGNINGGSVLATCGNGFDTGEGGGFFFTGGVGSTSGPGGSFWFTGGEGGATGVGGEFRLVGGAGGSTGVTVGGAVTITAGAGGSGGAGASGAITIESPAAGGSGTRGILTTNAETNVFNSFVADGAVIPFQFSADASFTSNNILFQISDNVGTSIQDRLRLVAQTTASTDLYLIGGSSRIFLRNQTETVTMLLVTATVNSGVIINASQGGGANDLKIITADATSTGPVNITTGDASSTTSGGIFLTTGTAGTTRGGISLDAPFIGFYGTTPAAQSAAYTITNVTPTRTYDADSTTLDEIADVLGTLIADLQLTGLIG